MRRNCGTTGCKVCLGTDFFACYCKETITWFDGKWHKVGGTLHADKHDSLRSVHVIFVEDYGAVFSFPELGLGYMMKTGDILIFDSHAEHTYTDIIGRDDSQRLCLTFFYNVNLERSTECTSYPEDLVAECM